MVQQREVHTRHNTVDVLKVSKAGVNAFCHVLSCDWVVLRNHIVADSTVVTTLHRHTRHNTVDVLKVSEAGVMPSVMYSRVIG